MNKGEGHSQGIGNSSCTFRTSRVWRNNYSLLVVGNVELYVFAEEVTAIKIVYWNVEEALVLGVYRCVNYMFIS